MHVHANCFDQEARVASGEGTIAMFRSLLRAATGSCSGQPSHAHDAHTPHLCRVTDRPWTDCFDCFGHNGDTRNGYAPWHRSGYR